MNLPIHQTRVLTFLIFGSTLLSTACVNQTEPACPVSGCEEQEDGTVVTIGDPSESESNPADPTDASTTDDIDDPSSPSDSSAPDEPGDGQDPSEVDPSETVEDCAPPIVSALYDNLDAREPDTQELTGDALITYLADRARDRHAREDVVNGVPFRRYDHYLPFYWEQRIANLEIIDRVAVGGLGITFNFTTLAQLNPAEFRTFYANGAAVYHNNMSDYLNAGVELVSVQPSILYPGETEYMYSALISNKSPENRPLELGDRIEIELSQFLLAPRNGRSNYYGTALLYVVGEGIVPWYAQAKEQATSETEREYASFDSFPLPLNAWLGGGTTLPYQYSNEPEHRFKQMAGNITPASGHPFMHGRRLHHTDFATGVHSEPGNPIFEAYRNRVGTKRVSESCVSCHVNNGRDLTPQLGAAFGRAVVKIGTEVPGVPHPLMGDSLQPKSQLEVSGDVLIRQEAEDYINASGIELESSNDVGGGLNIGYLDPGDQLTYELSSEDALEPGAYALAFRHASQIDGGRFLVRAPERDEILGSVTVPNTGGWQNWETSSIMVQITARTERLELVAETGGWNLNWFEIYAADSVTLAEGLLSIADYETIEGTYADGEAYTLTRPLYTFGQVTPEHYSVRVAPQLIGLGLLEAVPADYLAELADPCDEDGDGISGKLRVVPSRTEAGKDLVGRFGYRASQPSIAYQIAIALNRDMGIASDLFPKLDGESDARPGSEWLDQEALELMRRYVSLLGVPARRDLHDDEALRGEALFEELSCSSCHQRTMTTDDSHPYAELRNQTFHPYTDLLLHDMGPGLADTLNEVGANETEWRTAPLWGIGLTEGVSGGRGYLHDGRAETLSEAILWHGGEAENSKEAFRGLSRNDRNALIRFLKSL